MEREHGRIVSVSTRPLGSTLNGDTASGATSLVMEDAADFNATGGTLSINDSQLAYSTYDDDTATITLTDSLPAAASDGDFVACWDTLYNTAGTEKTAMVQLDGDDDNPDPIEATVPHFLADKLADGDRGGPGESVVVKYDEEEDEWLVADVRGLAGASGAGVKFCDTDTFTVQAAGDQTIALSHEPLPGSLDVKWHPDGKGGIALTSADWTLAGSTLTVPDPNGVLAVNDLIDPQYAYRDGPIAPPLPGVTFQASGWKYLQVASTDTTDYSAANFNDSGWSVGTAAFGGARDAGWPADWPNTTTAWATSTDLWLRRSIPMPAGVAVTVTVRVDNTATVYWNGAQVGTAGNVAEVPIAVPGGSVKSQNTLAVRGHDTGITAYLDVQVSG